MADSISIILNNNLVLFAVISLFAIVIIAVVTIYMVAFFQGRSISFWPPEIGNKPQTTNYPDSDNFRADAGLIVSRPDYYEKYYSLVSKAKKNVLMVGDGFSCHESDSSKYAYGLINALREALKNGALVKRFQYTTTLSLIWLRLLCDLKEEFGDRFQVYMHKEFDPTVLPYTIILVDHDQQAASANIMFTRLSDTSLEERLAGPAFIFDDGPNLKKLVELMRMSIDDFFLSNYNISCSDLLDLHDLLKQHRKESIIDYYSGQQSIDVDSTSTRKVAKSLSILDVDLVFETALQEISNRNEIYFGYGSNIDKARIRRRCPSARVIAKGKILDYRLVFNMLGNNAEGKGGGVANIEKANGDIVYGVLYRIETNELQQLNSLEMSMNYEVEQMNIFVSDIVSVEATVYISYQEQNNRYTPTNAYRNFIINGMEMHNFPIEYQNQIKALMEV